VLLQEQLSLFVGEHVAA
jgi:hypothetical protein